MKKITALCALSFLFAAPAWAGEPNPVMPAVDSVNHFAFQMAEKLDGDFFFSPWSVVSALGMTYAGAREATALEMERALLFDSRIHAALGELSRELESNSEDFTLTTANRVWLRTGLNLKPDFSRTLRQDYRSTAAKVDFKGDPEAARQDINEWVELRTHDRIKNLLRRVEPDTQMVLTNAVYFNGKWRNPFDEGRTSPEPFHVTESLSKDVPMMKQGRRLNYGELEDGTKLLRLPYEGRLSMLLVLPGGEKPELEKVFSSKRLSTYEVDLWLPKFKTEERYELKEILEAMGVKLAFGNRADFSGMTADEKLKIDAVIHQTFIEVDEKKTEAAAATGVVMMRATAMPRPLPRAEFHADRPFFYFIMDNPTGVILFMGRQSFSDD